MSMQEVNPSQDPIKQPWIQSLGVSTAEDTGAEGGEEGKVAEGVWTGEEQRGEGGRSKEERADPFCLSSLLPFSTLLTPEDEDTVLFPDPERRKEREEEGGGEGEKD